MKLRAWLLGVVLNCACAAQPGAWRSAERSFPPPIRPAVAKAGRPFVHPGILVTRAELDFVAAKLRARAEPWSQALAALRANPYASPGYEPHPRPNVECGPYSNPDIGCGDEKDDVLAAYAHALLWAYTGDAASGAKSIEIMNAWSATLREHSGSNAPLQSAWAAEVFPRAAEIMRYTSRAWPEAEVARFGKMLDEVYLPRVSGGSGSNGNWELSMIEATLNIAVFNDDRFSFDHAVEMWRQRAPAYIYLRSDGATQVAPPRSNKRGATLTQFWHGQSELYDGLSQETCRDLLHAQFGLASLINTAETARIQGIDLYGEQAERLRAGLEFHAHYLNGAAVPESLCGGSLERAQPRPMWEIAYNHFVNRRGESLPETARLLHAVRPTATDHHMAWETLTHAEVGKREP